MSFVDIQLTREGKNKRLTREGKKILRLLDSIGRVIDTKKKTV